MTGHGTFERRQDRASPDMLEPIFATVTRTSKPCRLRDVIRDLENEARENPQR